jgi:hypothetical protein
MPGMAKPTMFDDMPTKRPHFFWLSAGIRENVEISVIQ